MRAVCGSCGRAGSKIACKVLVRKEESSGGSVQGGVVGTRRRERRRRARRWCEERGRWRIVKMVSEQARLGGGAGGLGMWGMRRRMGMGFGRGVLGLRRRDMVDGVGGRVRTRQAGVEAR